MEKLLEMANKVCDQAEIYSIEYSDNAVSFQDAKLHEIESSYQMGLSLRIIKDGRQGFAYTRNLIDRQELLNNALISLKGGVEADFDLPLTKDIPEVSAYDTSLVDLDSTRMVEEGDRICEILKTRTQTEILLSGFKHLEKMRIINSAGTDISDESSYYGIYAVAVFPGSGSGVYRYYLSKRFEKMPDAYVDEIADLFNLTKKDANPKGGRMKVLFMPNSMITFNWRIQSGTNSRNLYEKTTPIADKVGEKIFSDSMTIYDDPIDSEHPGGRAFDDEGIAGKRLMLIDSGVFKNFYYDLNYAAKLKAKSTGHGFKSSQWGGDVVTLKPQPGLQHLRLKPGDKSFGDLIKSMDRGVIVEGAMGAHSGNIPNGDYSIGLSPGLYVENGEIVGRVKDAMVAGNIYETLKNVINIGDTLYPSFGGSWMAPILCDNVSVSTRG
jgi:PmbA protein